MDPDCPTSESSFVSSLSLKDEEHRSATPQDLVLDLIYVVFLSKLGSYFREELDKNATVAFRDFCALFIPLWFQWWATCHHLNRWETKDAVNVLFFAGNMVLLATLGISSLQCGSSDRESCRKFAFSFAGARAWLVLFQALVAWHNPRYRRAVALHAVPDTAVVVIWIVVGLLPQTECGEHFNSCWLPFVFFWWLGMVCDFLKHLLSRPAYVKGSRLDQFLPLNLALTAERHELFIVVSIGELITASLSYELEEEEEEKKKNGGGSGDDDDDDNDGGHGESALASALTSDHDDGYGSDDHDDHGDFYARLYATAFFVVLIAVFIKLRYFDALEHPAPTGSRRHCTAPTATRHAMSVSHHRGFVWAVLHIPLNIAIVS